LYYMEKKYVFDASTIILLAKVTLLRTISGQWNIIITTGVKKEIMQKPESEDAQIIFHLIREEAVHEVKALHTNTKKEFGLGMGEAETLQFAFEEEMIMATDDWKAIKACKIMGIKFVTAIHCLIYLYKNKFIEKKMALEKLKNLEKYGRYNTEIIKDARQQIQGD